MQKRQNVIKILSVNDRSTHPLLVRCWIDSIRVYWCGSLEGVVVLPVIHSIIGIKLCVSCLIVGILLRYRVMAVVPGVGVWHAVLLNLLAGVVGRRVLVHVWQHVV